MGERDLGEAQVAGAGTHGCSKLGRVPVCLPGERTRKEQVSLESRE